MKIYVYSYSVKCIEIIELYPKGGLMVINETKLSDKKAERNVEKMHIQKKDISARTDWRRT